MHHQTVQVAGAQPQTASRATSTPTTRPFEITYPGQEIASSPTNPFPSRPHEVCEIGSLAREEAIALFQSTRSLLGLIYNFRQVCNQATHRRRSQQCQ